MIKFLRRFPTVVDIQVLYLLSNIWWFIVFSSPAGYFTGILYDRATIFLGKDVLVFALGMLILVAIIGLIRTEYKHISLILGSMSYLYFGVMSVIGPEIALNAGILFIIPIIGIYRLYSYTLYHETDTRNEQ